MVATSAAQTTQTKRSGLRPVRPRRDLAAIADLIEVCFADTLDAGGRSMLRDMRMMSNSNPLIWLLARMGRAIPSLNGFVWLDDDRIVGNVSITPADYGKGFVIANVAVYPDYRRQGIARKLMHAAMAHVAQRGPFAVLQVDAGNDAARTLYEDLGFRTQRVFTRWRRASYHRLPLPAAHDTGVTVRRAHRDDWSPLFELASELRPDNRGGMGWLRPTAARALRPPQLPALHYLLSGQRAEYWVIPGQRHMLDAALRVEHRMGALTVYFDLLVRRERRGELEGALLHHLIARYPRRPLVADHPDDDQVTHDIIQRYQFRPERTLAHMIWHVPPAR